MPTNYSQWEPGLNAARSIVRDSSAGGRVSWIAFPRSPLSRRRRPIRSSNVLNLAILSRHSTRLRASRVRGSPSSATRTTFLLPSIALNPTFAGRHRFVPKDAANGEVHVFPDLMPHLPRTLDYDDHVAVRIDTAHNHVGSMWLRVNINGARKATVLSAAMNWAAIPDISQEGPAEKVQWQSQVHELPDRWRAALKITLASNMNVDPTAQPTIGVHLARARYGDTLRHLTSAATLPAYFAQPLAFNDLCLGNTGVTVEKITWADRAYDQNALSLLRSQCRAGPPGSRGRDASAVRRCSHV